MHAQPSTEELKAILMCARSVKHMISAIHKFYFYPHTNKHPYPKYS